MSRGVILSIVGIAIFMGASYASPTAYSCAEIDGAKPQRLLEYIQGDRPTLKLGCVVLALQRLNHYPPAVKALIKYLDYAVPEDPSRAHGPTIARIPTVGERYPAVTSLFEIGRPAAPDLVTAIGEESTSEVARGNAIETLFEIYSGNLAEAVALLHRASVRASGTRSEYLLLDSARNLAGKCRGDGVNACLKALER